MLVTLCALRITWNVIGTQSCLSALLPLTEGQAGHADDGLEELRTNLNQYKELFTRSTAHLYTPNIEDIHNCTFKYFDCFLMEIKVVLYEESAKDFHMVNGNLELYRQKNCSARYPCELLELNNSIVFYNKTIHFLEKLITECKNNSNATCD